MPVAMRKMPSDEGFMFHFDYWGFEDQAELKVGSADRDNTATFNQSMLAKFEPPLLLHGDWSPNLSRRFLPSFFDKRDFSCPDGTTSCDSINRPNTCCANGLTCNTIENTGLGDVGCCAGSSCFGQVSQCQEGYTACPGDQGGGCCVPGYVCNGDVGCKSPHQRGN